MYQYRTLQPWERIAIAGSPKVCITVRQGERLVSTSEGMTIRAAAKLGARLQPGYSAEVLMAKTGDVVFTIN